MLLVDGCFLVGLLMKYRKRNSEEPTYWVGFEEGQIFHDLMKIENQIPFFVVEKLYNLLVPPDDDHISIIELAHSYLKEYLELVVCCGKNFNLENQKVQHLFDLLYQIQVTGDWTLNHKETPSDKRWSCKWIQCATKLRDCGIRFHQKKGTSILDVKFQKGVMEIPSTSMFDGVVPILKNLIAYEQCYSPIQYFTTYASFMDFLIDTPKDGKVLCDANIIELSFSNKDEVSTVFNNL
ncbi:UPF0481 protein [Acorus gramineus]|uniref:UPF0481 protein n=1 Tax=Acorus gramineus TaxID=55184 RepID=A0AAV9BLK1_ACOGR|nr:UPF0481 protein [Acorus gramineus]